MKYLLPSNVADAGFGWLHKRQADCLTVHIAVPIGCIILAAIAAVICTSGMAKYTLETEPTKIWLPRGAEVKAQADEYVDHFGKARLERFILTPKTRAGGVLNQPFFDGLYKMHKHITEALNVTVRGKRYFFNDICFPVHVLNESGCFEFNPLAFWPNKTNPGPGNFGPPSDILSKYNQGFVPAENPWTEIKFVAGGRTYNNSAQGSSLVDARSLQVWYYFDDSPSRHDATPHWGQVLDAFERRLGNYLDRSFNFSTVHRDLMNDFGEQVEATILSGTPLLISSLVLMCILFVLSQVSLDCPGGGVALILSCAGVFSVAMAVASSMGLAAYFGLEGMPTYPFAYFILVLVGLSQVWILLSTHHDICLEATGMGRPHPSDVPFADFVRSDERTESAALLMHPTNSNRGAARRRLFLLLHRSMGGITLSMFVLAITVLLCMGGPVGALFAHVASSEDTGEGLPVMGVANVPGVWNAAVLISVGLVVLWVGLQMWMLPLLALSFRGREAFKAYSRSKEIEKKRTSRAEVDMFLPDGLVSRTVDSSYSHQSYRSADSGSDDTLMVDVHHSTLKKLRSKSPTRLIGKMYSVVLAQPPSWGVVIAAFVAIFLLSTVNLGLYGIAWVEQTEQSVLPKDNFVHRFFDIYDNDYADVGIPCKFVLRDLNYSDAANVPIINRLTQSISNSTYLQNDTLKNWYFEYLGFLKLFGKNVTNFYDKIDGKHSFLEEWLASIQGGPFTMDIVWNSNRTRVISSQFPIQQVPHPPDGLHHFVKAAGSLRGLAQDAKVPKGAYAYSPSFPVFSQFPVERNAQLCAFWTLLGCLAIASMVLLDPMSSAILIVSMVGSSLPVLGVGLHYVGRNATGSSLVPVVAAPVLAYALSFPVVYAFASTHHRRGVSNGSRARYASRWPGAPLFVTGMVAIGCMLPSYFVSSPILQTFVALWSVSQAMAVFTSVLLCPVLLTLFGLPSTWTHVLRWPVCMRWDDDRTQIGQETLDAGGGRPFAYFAGEGGVDDLYGASGGTGALGISSSAGNAGTVRITDVGNGSVPSNTTGGIQAAHDTSDPVYAYRQRDSGVGNSYASQHRSFSTTFFSSSEE